MENTVTITKALAMLDNGKVPAGTIVDLINQDADAIFCYIMGDDGKWHDTDNESFVARVCDSYVVTPLIIQ